MTAVGLPVRFDQSAQGVGQRALQRREPPLESALYLGLVVPDRRRQGEYRLAQDLFEVPERCDRPSELLPEFRRMQMRRKQRRQGVEIDDKTLLLGRIFHFGALFLNMPPLIWLLPGSASIQVGSPRNA